MTFCKRLFNLIPQCHASISPFKLTANPWMSFKFHEQHCEVCSKKNHCTARFQLYSDTLCLAFAYCNKFFCSFFQFRCNISCCRTPLKIGCCSSRLTMTAITNCRCVKRAQQHLCDRLLARALLARQISTASGRSETASESHP